MRPEDLLNALLWYWAAVKLRFSHRCPIAIEVRLYGCDVCPMCSEMIRVSGREIEILLGEEL